MKGIVLAINGRANTRVRELGTRRRGDPADFDFGPAEIDQQAQGLARRPQVVAALLKMHFAQRGNHRKFGDDLVLDQQAGGIFANDHAIAKDDGTALPNRAEPELSHLVGKGFFVNLFNEPMSGHVGNPERTRNDPPGRRPQQPRIPYIPAYPANPP
jgi:hypothetical protein